MLRQVLQIGFELCRGLVASDVSHMDGTFVRDQVIAQADRVAADMPLACSRRVAQGRVTSRSVNNPCRWRDDAQ